MAIGIDDKFLSLHIDETRCPEKVRAIAPSAKRIYVLRDRFDCSHWDRVRDCFHGVKGSYIVIEPVAGRKYFTLHPKMVIDRLQKAGIW